MGSDSRQHQQPHRSAGGNQRRRVDFHHRRWRRHVLETGSFTYAYQQVTGDFDIKVRILNVEATDAQLRDSPKASLMVRKSLEPDALDFMINALPLAPSGRDSQIESIGRVSPDGDTDDLPGRGSTYGGDTTDKG